MSGASRAKATVPLTKAPNEKVRNKPLLVSGISRFGEYRTEDISKAPAAAAPQSNRSKPQQGAQGVHPSRGTQPDDRHDPSGNTDADWAE
jgi:hypothetical protein